MSNDAIDQFWQWWETAKQPFADGVRGNLDPKWIEAMSAHVAAIGPDLDWELGKGKESEHHLCLSAKGDPVGRVLTERWLARGPERDDTWEYHPARQAGEGGMTLEIDGHRVALEEMTFELTENETKEVLDISAWHPAFAQIEDEELRARITFIALDSTLGEDGVERWAGRIKVADAPLEESVLLEGLREAVADLAERSTGDRWAVLRGQNDAGLVFITANVAAKRIDHLERDVHIKVTLRLADPNENGLTTNEEAEVLNEIEDALNESLGEHALYIGRVTTNGRREVHFRAQEGGPSASVFDAWAKKQTAYTPEIEMKLDPRWDEVPW